jgi:hypothetical protein
MQLNCSSQVKLRGCIAPSDTLSSHALDHGVNRFSVFGLGGGGVSLRAAGNHSFEKSSLLEKVLSIAEAIISLSANCHLYLKNCAATSSFLSLD